MVKIGSILMALTFLLSGCATNSLTVVSPGETVRVELAPGAGDSVALAYSVAWRGGEAIATSPLGLELKGVESLAEDLTILGVERRAHDETWRRPWGKSAQVFDRYNEMLVHLANRDQTAKMDLIVRAYDDGVALRYSLPEQDGLKDFELSEDKTGFYFPGDREAWAAQYGGFVSHQEAHFNRMLLSDPKFNNVTGLPVLVQAGERCWAAVTEANLTDWAGMYLRASGDGEFGFNAALSPLPDAPETLVKSSAPRRTPWRVIMLGDSAASLIDSDLIANLNDPSVLTGADWIEPGKCAWDWWWCNGYDEDIDFKMGSNTETMKHFIDLASEMGWRYQLVDWHWYGAPFLESDKADPNADITAMNTDIDIPELVRYGAERGVGIWLWLEWSHAAKQMDEAFPLYEKWGVAGVKVDFMQRDDQEMVNFYHRLVKLAAAHHLMVDFHGAYKPTGFCRTYPNLMTRGGVMGNEHNKWSQNITAEHKVTIPFTRGLLGEMDFTPGAWASATPESFRINSGVSPYTMTMGTRCNEMAMFVVYESALTVLCDSPFQYHRSPAGTDFLKIVPTSWDETRALNGAVGDYVMVARRSGDEWFVGVMTDENARKLSIPFDFLGLGEYEATLWQDASDADVSPEHIMKSRIPVTRADLLDVNAAPNGGCVLYLKKK